MAALGDAANCLEMSKVEGETPPSACKHKLYTESFKFRLRIVCGTACVSAGLNESLLTEFISVKCLFVIWKLDVNEDLRPAFHIFSKQVSTSAFTGSKHARSFHVAKLQMAFRAKPIYSIFLSTFLLLHFTPAKHSGEALGKIKQFLMGHQASFPVSCCPNPPSQCCTPQSPPKLLTFGYLQS